MITHKYGEFSEEQMEEYKKKLHDRIFWLLLYKDENVEESIEDEYLQELFFSLMIEINGLNSLLYYPPEIVKLLSFLQEAKYLARQEPFRFKVYRKLILDAEALVSQICEKEVAEE